MHKAQIISEVNRSILRYIPGLWDRAKAAQTGVWKPWAVRDTPCRVGRAVGPCRRGLWDTVHFRENVP